MLSALRLRTVSLAAVALMAGCECGKPPTQQVTITVVIDPASVTLTTGATQAFTATVVGGATGNVLWTVEESTGGTITSEGRYTAPTTVGAFHVRATSVDDATAFARATVSIIPGGPGVTINITPSTVTLNTGATQQFLAVASSGGVTWSIQEGAAGGTVSAGGLYTAPNAPGTFRVVATSIEAPTVTATATVTVSDGPKAQVSINPSAVTLGAGQTRQFAATVTGVTNTTVTWDVQPAGSGTITTGGFYTAPTTPGVYQVVATSAAQPTASATAQVTVEPIVVNVTPPTALVEIGSTQQFTAVVTGASNTAVTWSVMGGPTCGTVTSAGLYTPPSTVGTCTIIATSVASTGTTASAVATVINPVTVTLSPMSATLSMNQTQQFTATVVGSTNQAVSWSVREGAVGGSVDATGLYTAPVVTASTMFHVVATPQANPAKFVEATVTVNPGIGVQITPALVTLSPNGMQAFTATVTGTANTMVTWAVQEGAPGGTVTNMGAYTAPSSSGTYHVVATSVDDTTKKGFATIVVLGAPVDVSGTVTYTGSKTGTVYVILAQESGVFGIGANGGDGIVGTSVTLTGSGSTKTAAYTVRGVRQRGSLRLRAFMDTLGSGMFHQAVDPSGAVTINVGNSGVTNGNVTMQDSSWNKWTSIATPSIDRVVPGDEAVLVAYTPAYNLNGQDVCKDYRIYWSDTPNVGSSNNIGSLLVTANAPRWAVVRGLTNGQQLYFTMTCPDAFLGGLSAEKSVTVGPASGNFTIDGVVNNPTLAAGVVPPLYVVALAAAGTGGFMTRVSSPLAAQPWSIPGVTTGDYFVYAFRDMGGDGKLTPTDIGNFFDPVRIRVTNSTSVPAITLSGANGVAKVSTGHVNDTGTESYSLFFRVLANLKRPVKAQVTAGPKVSFPYDLPLNETGGARHEVAMALGTVAPAMGDAYTVAVTYSDGTSENLTATVSALLPTFVVAAPMTPSSRTPTFQWAALTPTPATTYYSSLRVYDYSYLALGTGGTLMASKDDIASTTTLFLWSDIALPGRSMLNANVLSYWWTLRATDANGNWAETVSSFIAQ
ncbi:MAG: hypothetical protein JNG84_05280 [Archangium sp.]|nr:hypothetical protein [Archangium sp.]